MGIAFNANGEISLNPHFFVELNIEKQDQKVPILNPNLSKNDLAF